LYDAEINFQYFEEKICFIGHSHRPFIIERLPSCEMVVYNERVEFRQSCRYMINAGSVGQPRDGDPRAAYVILDEGKVEILRVEYDYKRTQQKMKEANLPEFLIERLEKGI
jgi:diadenosine tetraphosphatase ApaH/serine/threonine PP2A family protein phosphatase